MASRRPTIEPGPHDLDSRDLTDFKHWQAPLVKIDSAFSDFSGSGSSLQSNRVMTPSSETNKEFFEEEVLSTEPQELAAIGSHFMRNQNVSRGLGIKLENDGHPNSAVVVLPLEIRAIGS